MPTKKVWMFALLAAFYTPYISAETKTIDMDTLNGNWHLRIMDGKEVRKARAILDFDTKKMTISGFDGCNQITGILKVNTDTSMSSQLKATRMACRQPIHTYVSQRLHEVVKDGFTVRETNTNGVDGITLKNQKHTLFFGKMGERSMLDKLVK